MLVVLLLEISYNYFMTFWFCAYFLNTSKLLLKSILKLLSLNVSTNEKPSNHPTRWPFSFSNDPTLSEKAFKAKLHPKIVFYISFALSLNFQSNSWNFYYKRHEYPIDPIEMKNENFNTCNVTYQNITLKKLVTNSNPQWSN